MRKFIFSWLGLLVVSASYSQNVGVGITTPTAPLHIKSLIYTNPLIVDGISPLWFTIAEGGLNRGYWGSYTGNPEDVDFGTYSGNVTGKVHLTIQSNPRLTVNASGNVGIGTTDPSLAQLQIIGAVGENMLYTRAGVSGPGLAMFVPISSPTLGFNMMYQSSTYKHLDNGYAGMFQYNVSTGDLLFYSTTASGAAGANASIGGAFFTLDAAGRVGISTSAPAAKLHVNGNMVIGSGAAVPAVGYQLSVDGKIICEEARVQNSTAWPDYVFSPEYKLRPLDELEKLIRQNKHLPNIEPASVVEKEGFDLGRMNIKLLEKIEELTLYIIEINKENKKLNERVKSLEEK